MTPMAAIFRQTVEHAATNANIIAGKNPQFLTHAIHEDPRDHEQVW